MSWLGGAPERDLTSNFADDVGLRCNGDGWGGCVGVAHQAGTCEGGGCHIWVDAWSSVFHDVDDDGNSRTGCCYFSPNALRHVWVQ